MAGKKPKTQLQRPPLTVEQDEETKLIIARSLDTLSTLPAASEAIEILKRLQGLKNESWLHLTTQSYFFGQKLYDNRRWLEPQSQERLPPGTTFLGIVLDKTLEVSVVETLGDGRVYHRPMALLPPGSVFGTFEAADLFVKTLPLQNYTVFSGTRTFFFADPRLDAYSAKADFNRALSILVPGGKEVLEEWSRQKDTYSPTQMPLSLLKIVLEQADFEQWQSRVLLITLGAEFQEKAPREVIDLIFHGAWRQSAHLRASAVSGFLTDKLVQALRSNNQKVQGEFGSSIARELDALRLIVTDQRPAFRGYPADEKVSSYGPFEAFFKTLNALIAEGRLPKWKREIANAFDRDVESRIFLPSLIHDTNSPLCFPIWPNIDPLCKYAGYTSGTHGGPNVLKRVLSHWDDLRAILLTGPHAYLRDAISLNLSKSPAVEPIFLRGYVEILQRAPRLPVLEAVPAFAANKAACLIGVQHLMEETVSFVEEIIRRNLIAGQSIWLLGKPYSSNARIAHRLRLLGVNIEIPPPDWAPGEFDSWFAQKSAVFLKRAIQSITRELHLQKKPILLLDDGGTLVTAAKKLSWPGGFRAVEQTSRGIRAAKNARFPVVLVACSALKSLIEPEFVARAAVSKLAHYYPEALRSERVGVIGLGNLGSYLAKYLLLRRDIRVREVIGTDPSRSKSEGWSPRQNPLRDFIEASTDEKDLSFNLVGDAQSVFDACDVIYGCTGNDLGRASEQSSKRSRMLISVSSGDVEFASLLKSGKGAKSIFNESIFQPYRCGGDETMVVNGGFPITFDGEPISAPLVEMQLTRALLIAGLQQALVSTPPAPVELDASVQNQIWESWKKNVLLSTDEPAISWQKEREAEELGELGQLEKRIGSYAEGTLQRRNKECFETAVVAA